ncbi:MAG: BlaI/MecI/CopY family transcriptional regulator [Lawsonibacter sp.]|nr:BlaI/MecI/CopY family transcriptional regulator [Lawsonibacter sp.]
MKQIAAKISGSELEVLSVLWEGEGPMALSEIRQALAQSRSWDGSTVKTLVRRLCEKGALRAEKCAVYRYAPLISREEYRAWSTQDLIDRLFRGSARQLAASLVEGDRLSRGDVQELLELLDRRDGHE